jgi:hypothetical protein
MLEFWIMKRVALIKTIKLILLIKKLHSKGLERSVGDMGAKKGHYLMFSIRFKVLALQMKICYFQNVLKSCILFCLYLNMTLNIFFN